MKYEKLTKVEYEFMEYAWSSQQPLNFQDFKHHFIKKISAQEWIEKTISTYLSVLVKKKFLNSERDGRIFYYTPAVSRLDYQQFILNETLNKKVGSSLEGIVAAFCGIDNASEEDLESIDEYLAELAKKLNKDKPN